MSRTNLSMSISADGYVAGPGQCEEQPLGVGGGALHDWHLGSAKNHPVNRQVVSDMMDGMGATIMGRNMFGGHPGPWSDAKPWNGWWGKTPPFHHQVFVLTHYPREPLVLEGGTTFNFVTTGIQAALDQAREAAAGKDVALAGGAKAAQQYLTADLVDEMDISLVPILLGNGEHLFDGVGTDLHGLQLVRTIAAPGVTHLKFEKAKSA